MPHAYTVFATPGDEVAIVGSRAVRKECPLCMGGDLNGTDVVNSVTITVIDLAGFRLPCPMCHGRGDVDTGETVAEALLGVVQSIYLHKTREGVFQEQYTVLVHDEKYPRNVEGERVFPTLGLAQAQSDRFNASAQVR